MADLNQIIEQAWTAYDASRGTLSVTDISAKVSTNHVYKVDISDGTTVIAKLSFFGKYEHFVEDHTIINVLSNNLPAPFDNFLARSLMKGSQLFTYHFEDATTDAWVVFYLPMQVSEKMPRRLDEKLIRKMGSELAHFHSICTNLRNTLPRSSKTMAVDIMELMVLLKTRKGKLEHGKHVDLIYRHCNIFLENLDLLWGGEFHPIPIFVDWNIGNFSVTPSGRLFSRWDYDWFRMSTRMMDFYFFSRVVSDIGDRTVFTYNVGPLMEERFILFLKKYHEKFPLTENEVRFLIEAYRFFLLHYVVKYGHYFFHTAYANKLQQEAYESHFPSIEKIFDAEILLRALKI